MRTNNIHARLYNCLSRPYLMKKAFTILFGIACLVTYSMNQVDSKLRFPLPGTRLKPAELTVKSISTDATLVYPRSLTFCENFIGYSKTKNSRITSNYIRQIIMIPGLNKQDDSV